MFQILVLIYEQGNGAGEKEAAPQLLDPVQWRHSKKCQAVVFFFSFVKNKPTSITNMSLPKLISNVILICALMCVFGQDLEHYISLLCC